MEKSTAPKQSSDPEKKPWLSRAHMSVKLKIQKAKGENLEMLNLPQA